MALKQSFDLHHLPPRGQTFFYLLILIASPIINLGVNSLIYTDFRLISLKGKHAFGTYHWLFGISSFLLGALVILLGINLAHALLARHRQARQSLLLFGLVSSLYLGINLLTVSYGIFEFKVQSLFLLVVSMCVYISLNITFLFWYWYVDYPSQIRHLRHPECRPEICFPDNADHTPGWLPNVWDYLYFAILTSNTLGPPENHSASGRRVKFVVLMQSLVMLIVLVVFISRAINTLT
jgi:hypothetical protein